MKDSAYSTTSATLSAVEVVSEGDNPASSAAAYISGFYFEYEVLTQFPSIARQYGLDIQGSLAPNSIQQAAFNNFNDAAMLKKVSSVGYRRHIVTLGKRIKSAAKETIIHFSKEANEALADAAKKVIIVNNSALDTKQALGDLTIAFGEQDPISVELKWSQSSKPVRYFGPKSDLALFGPNNYFEYVKIHHWGHDKPRAQWVQELRTGVLEKFLNDKFQSSAALINYLLTKGRSTELAAGGDFIVRGWVKGRKAAIDVEDLAGIATQLNSMSQTKKAFADIKSGILRNAIVFQNGNEGQDLAAFSLTKYKLPENYSQDQTEGVDAISFHLYIHQKILGA